MDINTLKAKVDELNARSAKINTIRNQNIGKRQTLIEQCNTLFEQYNASYGVSLTPETLDAEIARVMAEKEKEVDQLEKVLAAVDRGDFVQANAWLGVSTNDTNTNSAQPATEVTTQSVVTAAQPEQLTFDTQTQPVINTPTPEVVAQPVINTPTPEVVAQPVINTPTPEVVAQPVINTPTPEVVAQPVINTPTPEVVAQPVINTSTPIPTIPQPSAVPIPPITPVAPPKPAVAVHKPPVILSDDTDDVVIPPVATPQAPQPVQVAPHIPPQVEQPKPQPDAAIPEPPVSQAALDFAAMFKGAVRTTNVEQTQAPNTGVSTGGLQLDIAPSVAPQTEQPVQTNTTATFAAMFGGTAFSG